MALIALYVLFSYAVAIQTRSGDVLLWEIRICVEVSKSWRRYGSKFPREPRWQPVSSSGGVAMRNHLCVGCRFYLHDLAVGVDYLLSWQCLGMWAAYRILEESYITVPESFRLRLFWFMAGRVRAFWGYGTFGCHLIIEVVVLWGAADCTWRMEPASFGFWTLRCVTLGDARSSGLRRSFGGEVLAGRDNIK